MKGRDGRERGQAPHTPHSRAGSGQPTPTRPSPIVAARPVLPNGRRTHFRFPCSPPFLPRRRVLEDDLFWRGLRGAWQEQATLIWPCPMLPHAQHRTVLPALAAQRSAGRGLGCALEHYHFPRCTPSPVPLLRCAAFLIPYPDALLLLSIFSTHACTPIKRHRPPLVRLLSLALTTCDSIHVYKRKNKRAY